MTLELEALDDYLNNLLQPGNYNDYCPNGLQVEGKQQITKLVSGVTACQALIEKAIAAKADAIIVHHGYFWKGENPVITGIKQRRIKSLLEHNISLFAYHLPLDAHCMFGNNVQLANLLKINITKMPANSGDLLFFGEIEPTDVNIFAQLVSRTLDREIQHIPAATKKIKHVAWCTGAAQDYIDRAAAKGAELFISGEISERTVHSARELNIHYFCI